MSNKIVVKHSRIEINDYELSSCTKLESYFSIYDRTLRINILKCLEYIPELNRLLIPRGVDVHFIESLLGEKATLDSHYDSYDKYDDIMIKYLPRDDRQKEALRFMLGKSEYMSNSYKSQLSVNLSTGFGKSFCSICTMAYTGIRSAVITSSLDWLEQWKDYILEYTNIKAKEIYIISGTPSIHSILKKDMSQYKFVLISHSTIKSYGDKYGWFEVTKLFQYLRIGYKFFDEAHLNFDNLCKIDMYTNTYRTYYVTATPARSSEEENFIYQLYFKNVPAIDLFDEDNDPHTSYTALKYTSHPSPQELSNCKNQYGLDRNKYTNYVVHTENYEKMLYILIDMALKMKGKALFYIGTNYAIDVTYNWIIANFPELQNDVGIYTSVIKQDKDTQLEKKIILSTTKSCGAAMDIKGLKMTVVLAEPFKSEVLARQTLGRTRANNTLYIEVVDKGFYYIDKYYHSKQPIFEKYATSCTEVILSDMELNNRVYEIVESRKTYYIPIIAFAPTIKPLTFLSPGEKLKPLIFLDKVSK